MPGAGKNFRLHLIHIKLKVKTSIICAYLKKKIYETMVGLPDFCNDWNYFTKNADTQNKFIIIIITCKLSVTSNTFIPIKKNSINFRYYFPLVLCLHKTISLNSHKPGQCRCEETVTKSEYVYTHTRPCSCSHRVYFKYFFLDCRHLPSQLIEKKKLSH